MALGRLFNSDSTQIHTLDAGGQYTLLHDGVSIDSPTTLHYAPGDPQKETVVVVGGYRVDPIREDYGFNNLHVSLARAGHPFLLYRPGGMYSFNADPVERLDETATMQSVNAGVTAAVDLLGHRDVALITCSAGIDYVHDVFANDETASKITRFFPLYPNPDLVQTRVSGPMNMIGMYLDENGEFKDPAMETNRDPISKQMRIFRPLRNHYLEKGTLVYRTPGRRILFTKDFVESTGGLHTSDLPIPDHVQTTFIRHSDDFIFKKTNPLALSQLFKAFHDRGIAFEDIALDGTKHDLTPEILGALEDRLSYGAEQAAAVTASLA